MATCGEHSGVCTSMEDCKRRVTEIEEKQETMITNKLFYTLISILVILFAGIFSVSMTTVNGLNRLESKINVQSVQISYINETINEFKGKIK